MGFNSGFKGLMEFIANVFVVLLFAFVVFLWLCRPKSILLFKIEPNSMTLKLLDTLLFTQPPPSLIKANTYLIFLFSNAVLYFRKHCRFQSIHSQFYICIYLLDVTRTTCFGLSYFRPSSGPSITLLLAMPGVIWLFYLATIPFNIIMF